MVKANFVFLSSDEKSGVQLYFDNAGEIVEIKWANDDYIASKLAEFNVKTVAELSEKLNAKPEQEIYEFNRKMKDGKELHGWTLDEPFPEASAPTLAIVSGKIKKVVENDYKVAVTVETAKNGDFTVVRGFAVYNEAAKKLYAVADKKRRLLDLFGVKDFADLKVGDDITFIQQTAGVNKYYEPTND